MYPFYTNFASGSVASTKFNYNGVKEWNLIHRKKGEKPHCTENNNYYY